ncbi:glutathione transferase GST 23-like [Tasmannia lanceolata]|uniref:glutathione transferase GST 23-like n=1 Tax=Tasmannia lanceolata TaxID=3420 RepID=UPI004063324B
MGRSWTADESLSTGSECKSVWHAAIVGYPLGGHGIEKEMGKIFNVKGKDKGGMAGEGVKLFGMWASPYVLRVIWALKLKGIEYEYIEEDLSNKSPLLLQYNSVYKKVPVLVYGQKPVAESLVIIEFIDEMWKHNPILPEDPYERAMARFWAKFVEEKCAAAIFGAFSKLGEEQEKFVKEAKENLRTLEEGLKGTKFFGGETLGFVDVVAGSHAFLFRVIEEIIGIKIIEEESLPLINKWFEDILDFNIVKESLPSRDKLLVHIKAVRERHIG